MVYNDCRGKCPRNPRGIHFACVVYIIDKTYSNTMYSGITDVQDH